MRTFLFALALLMAAAPAAAQKSRSAAADSSATHELRDVEVVPRPLNVDDLREAMIALYPPALYVSRTGGRVEVRFRVDAQGVPGNMVVTRSTEPAFNEPTLQALAKLRFSPAKVGGKPVAAWVLLPIEWMVGS